MSSQKQHDTDVQIALDQQQQEALVTYQNYISDLLLTQHLGSSRVGDEVRVVAGARTLNTLRQLDSERKGLLILFLYEAQLITGGSPIISLVNADLRKAYLNEADLRANLHGGVNLVGLNEVDLHGANLHGAYLTGAYLRGTHLEGADLSGTHLEGIDLSGAHLEGANLSEAYLSEAYLSGAHLDSADLHGSDLSDADLSDAVLRGANVTTEQLDKTKSLGGAIIPDGSKQP